MTGFRHVKVAIFHIFLLIVVFLSSCRPADPLLQIFEEESSQLKALERSIDSLQNEIAVLDRPLYQTLYELEQLRHRVTQAEKDSIEFFYQNYVFRYRRPIKLILEPYADSPFQFPVRTQKIHHYWQIPVIWGRAFYYDYNHLGLDIAAREGDSVFAIADGMIRYYQPAGGYGELVVVIEHRSTKSMQAYHLTPVFLSIYGHLRKSKERNGKALPWQNGDPVNKGDLIGFINDDAHNGDGAEHLHLGIRRQNAELSATTNPTLWLRGYDNARGEFLQYYIDPLGLFGRPVQWILPE